MLKHVWIGLVALLVKSVMTTLINYFMATNIRNVLIVNDLFWTYTNSITFQNELQSDVMTLPFYIMTVLQFLLVLVFF